MFALALLTNNSVFLFRAKILRKPANWSQQSCPFKKNSALISIGERKGIAFSARVPFSCFLRQIVAVQVVFLAAKHGSFSLFVFLCVLYSLFIR